MKRLLSLLLVLAGHSSIYAQTHAPLAISHLTGNLYVYTTWGLADGVPFPANGVYLVTAKGVVVIDTPWDTTQFQPLLDTIRQRHHQPVVLCVSTHWHADRTIGLDFMRAQGVKTYTTRKTDSLSRQNGKPRAEFLFDQDTTFTIGGYSIRAYYPGEGHTRDNIVIWFGKDRVLYGGCLIKSVEAPNIGYVADGNLAAYPQTIWNLQREFPHPAYVIPGHQGWAPGALEYTLKLVRDHEAGK